MFSSRAEPRSIAGQLVLLFTVAAALLLCCGLGIFYFILVRHAFEEDNAVLVDKIAALRASLQDNGPEQVRAQLAGGGAEQDWQIRLLDAAGKTFAETPGMNAMLVPGIFPPPEQNSSAPRDYHRAGKFFALTSARAGTPQQPFVVQVAQDRSSDEKFNREFAVLLAVLVGAGIVASSAIALGVTRHGLRPLSLMARTLARISPGHLSERVAPSGWPRELQPLAIAFDQMLERLENSFNRLSQFSADLAHELRTPISNIRGEAEVTLTRPRDRAEYERVLESTVAECERLSGVVDNLLFLARAETPEGHLTRTKFDGRAALEKLAGYYGPLADERRIEIVCAGEGEILAEPMLFNRGLSNLLENALRFTPEGGRVALCVAQTPEQTEVSVADNGAGIAPEHLPRVFDRFYRGDPSRNSPGAGLGLALVKSIAQLHGGSASIESTPAGGTRVTMMFPKREMHFAPSRD